MAPETTLRLVDPVDPENHLGSSEYDVSDGTTGVSFMPNGAARIEHSDGSVTFDDNPDRSASEPDDGDFYHNIANEIPDDELSAMASELLTGIDLDDQSRKDWLETRRSFIRLLGLKLEEPRGDIGTSSAPLEGMSNVRHPLLTEATIHFQANALGELLPASGPVKVRNDLPMRPDTPNPMMGNNGGPPLAPEGQAMDDLAAALEKDMNHFLTVTATEYIPDTDRMMFYIGFGGDGFKKVHHDVLKRRPVSESVDAEDIIVSNAATDIQNCGRVTHRIKMRPSILKRMQLAGAYRDVELSPPNPVRQTTGPEQEKAEIGGYKLQLSRPKDADYEIYECYCEWDLDQFAPPKFKGKGVPLPYVVTLEKDSRQVLGVRRNWAEDDEEALPKQFFVQFPFIRGLGFYGLGLGHIIGNVTMALTAIWRIMIDNGMFANFPGFLFAKTAGRQNTNTIRVPPGGGFPVDVPAGVRIQDAFMPLPYKDTGTAFVNLATHLEEVGQRLGQTAELNIGEGKQDVPVGTTMALIEQATKIMDSVHKRLHAAQAQEFQLLKERFKEDPEAFWRHNKRPARKWTIDQFKEALDQRELVPVADPNNPTSLHRIAKATIIDTLVTKYPLDMDKRAALKRIMRIADIDSEGLMMNQTAPPPPDPRMEAVKAKAQAEQMQAQIDQAKLQLDQQKQQADLQDNAAERAFKERMQQFEMQLEQMRVQAEMIIHAKDIQRDDHQAQQDMAIKHAETLHGMASDQANAQAGLQQDAQKHMLDLHANQQKHQQELQAQREQHQQQIELDRQKHAADQENQKKIAEAKAQAIGPAEEQKTKLDAEKHDQSMDANDQKLKMQGEKHKADLANNKKLTDAKAKAMNKPKPAGDK